MATPRARGGSSLTISPPIKRSPLVCCSSPQMMRRYVVLPQPDGPSSTMNSPFGTSKLMPLTAGTSPNFLTMFLVDTAAIEPPRIQHEAPAPPISRRRFVTCLPASEPASHTPARPDRVRPQGTRSGHSYQALPAHFFMMVSHCAVAHLTDSSALD